MLKRSAPEALDGSPLLLKRQCVGHFSPFKPFNNSPFNNRHMSPQQLSLLRDNVNSSPIPDVVSHSHKRARTESYNSPDGVHQLEMDYLKKRYTSELNAIKTEATKQIENLRKENNDLKKQVEEQHEINEKLRKENHIFKHGFQTLTKKVNGEKMLKDTINEQQSKIQQLEQSIYALRMHLSRANMQQSNVGWGGTGGNGPVF